MGNEWFYEERARIARSRWKARNLVFNKKFSGKRHRLYCEEGDKDYDEQMALFMAEIDFFDHERESKLVCYYKRLRGALHFFRYGF